MTGSCGLSRVDDVLRALHPAWVPTGFRTFFRCGATALNIQTNVVHSLHGGASLVFLNQLDH